MPLITILALERANNNCYEKRFMGDNKFTRESYFKTIETDDLDMYCLCHSTIIYPFSFHTYTIFFHKIQKSRGQVPLHEMAIFASNLVRGTKL